MSAENVEALRPKLQQAQKALEAALAEACEAEVAHADSEELLRLEESLTVAQQAARTAIATLQRLQQQREAENPQSRTHRFFVDDRGRQCDAFCVYPSRSPSHRKTLPPDYREGWLTIQCGEEIRRLTPIPEGWSELSSGELCQLLQKAAVAPRRPRATPDAASNPEPRV